MKIENERDHSIPEKVRRLFWDVNKETVDLVCHRAYIIRRIMDYGTVEDVKWMLRTYSPQEMAEVLRMRRGLSRKSACFWAAYFKIPKEEIACLKMPYQKEPKES